MTNYHHREDAQLLKNDPLLTNPFTQADSRLSGDILREAVGFITTGATDEAGSIYRLCRVPSNARLSQLDGLVEPVGGTADAGAAGDIGLYFATGHAPVPASVATVGGSGPVLTKVGYTAGTAPNALSTVATDGGGAVIDVDFFGSAVAFTTKTQDFDGLAAAGTGLVATNTKHNWLNESTTNTGAKKQLALWEAVGLSADPGGHFDICITLTTAVTSIATLLGVRARYTL